MSEQVESTESVTENDLFPQTGTELEYDITESDVKELFEKQEEEDTDSKDEDSSKTESTDEKDETTSQSTESDKETASGNSSQSTSSKTENGGKYDADGDGWTDGWN